MARRQRLSEIQIAELFDPPTEQRELVRYYTLSEVDLAAIARCRGDAEFPAPAGGARRELRSRSSGRKSESPVSR